MMFLYPTGSVSYCIDQLLHRGQAARKILAQTELVNPDPLDTLLCEIVDPVKKLFEEIGFDQPDVLFQPFELIA